MINVSDEFKNLMKERTDFKENAEITLADGNVLTLYENDFTVSNNSVKDGADSNSIPLGAAISRNIQIELMNDDEHLSTYDFFGAKIRLYLTFELSNTVEKIEYGTFTVISPETYGETVIITANDDMYKADNEYDTKLPFPTTIKEMLRDSCSSCGIPLKTSNIPNGDFIVAEKPSGDYTHRQIIGYIAMISVGNARINRQGSLEILSYDFSSFLDYENYNGGTFVPWNDGDVADGGTFVPWNDGDVADGGTLEDQTGYHFLYAWKNLKVDTDDIVITGVQTKVKDENNKDKAIIYGTEGYLLTIDNPLISNKEETVLSFIGDTLIGVPFRKFEGDYIGYPVAEFMDLAEIMDRRGNIYRTFITDIDFTFFGMTTLKNSAESTVRNGSKYVSDSVKTLIKARELVEAEKTDRELAIERLNKTLSESSGMYSTEELQEDGSTIYYLHDKPTIAESQNVMKLTAEAIGFSMDGGKTYPFGFTMDGEMIMRVIQTEGLNADWIKTGAFTVKDDGGNIIFSADMDTKSVVISGDFIRIGDKPVSEAISDVENTANEALEESKKSHNLNIILSNEYQGIPTDYQGNYTTFPSCKTSVHVLYGDTDVSKDCSYSIQKSSSVTGSWDNTNRIYTVTGLSTDTGWIDITASYLSMFNVTKRFNISKNKGGTPGQQGLQGIQGPQGEQGIPGPTGLTGPQGPKGEDGKSVTIKGSFDNPNQLPSTGNSVGDGYIINGELYVWDGNEFNNVGKIQGPSGTSSYLHIKYSNVSNPTTSSQMTETPSAYIGIYVDNIESDSDDPNKYKWSKFEGADGKTSYFHIKYSSVSNPTTSSQMTETPSEYIGTYVDYTEADSVDPKRYTWSRFQGIQGEKGEQGIPGIGIDGKTSYLHIKYSNDGGNTFTSNSGEDVGSYIGTCVDYNSADPTTVSSYKWAKIKGEDGPQGLRGPAGADGKQLYTWLKYADTPTTGMSDSPDGKSYIGLAYNKDTATESSNYSDYTWSLIKGAKGDTGVPGANGADGKTYYTWIKYATSASGDNMSDSPTGKTYIGLAYNKTTATESNNASDYTWSLIKGDKGDTGAAGRTYFMEPSTLVVKRSQDNSMAPNYITLSAYYRDGTTTARTAYSGRFKIEESTDGDTWKTVYTSSTNESTITHSLYSAIATSAGGAISTANGNMISVPRDVVAIRCTLYAAGGTTQVLDIQSIAVVTDIDALTHEEIFDLLTNNGEVKGIYKEGNQLYISFTYAKGGQLTLGGSNNGNGQMLILDASGNNIGTIDNSGVNFKKGSLKIGSNFVVDTSGFLSAQLPTFWSGIKLSPSVNGTVKSALTLASDDYLTIGQSGVSVGISGDTFVFGSLGCSGTKTRIVSTENYGERLQYCYEMATPIFGDVGQGITDDNGECYIYIDEIFSETVNSNIEYQVFLQKEGQGDIWVSEKTPYYFKVNGTKNLKFAWEIKVSQLEYENERLEEYDSGDIDCEIDYESEYINEMETLIFEQEEMLYESVE